MTLEASLNNLLTLFPHLKQVLKQCCTALTHLPGTSPAIPLIAAGVTSLKLKWLLSFPDHKGTVEETLLGKGAFYCILGLQEHFLRDVSVK